MSYCRIDEILYNGINLTKRNKEIIIMSEFTVWKVDMISYGEVIDTMYFSTEALAKNYIGSLQKSDLAFDIDDIQIYTSL